MQQFDELGNRSPIQSMRRQREGWGHDSNMCRSIAGRLRTLAANPDTPEDLAARAVEGAEALQGVEATCRAAEELVLATIEGNLLMDSLR